MMIKCLGTSVISKASVLVMIRFLSILIKGNVAGLDPVAITKFLPLMVTVSFSPATDKVCASTKLPTP